MSVHTLRELINRTYPTVVGLSALTAALDAKANNAPLDPALAARIKELLSALGAGDVLDGVSAPEAAPFLVEIRQLVRAQAKLLYPQTHATSWSYDDTQLLQEFGDFARFHGSASRIRSCPLSRDCRKGSVRQTRRSLILASASVGSPSPWPRRCRTSVSSESMCGHLRSGSRTRTSVKRACAIASSS